MKGLPKAFRAPDLGHQFVVTLASTSYIPGSSSRFHITEASWQSESVYPKGYAEFSVDYSAIPSPAGAPLMHRHADMVDIACCLNAVDKLAPRAHLSMHPGRRLLVRIPVRDVAHWSALALKEQLQNLLIDMTHDVWEVEFYKREDGRSFEQLSYLRTFTPADNGKPLSVNME